VWCLLQESSTAGQGCDGAGGGGDEGSSLREVKKATEGSRAAVD